MTRFHRMCAGTLSLPRTLDPIFPKQSQRGTGRHVYSEIDTAIEQDCDGEWIVGNMLTKDGSVWHLELTDGVLTSAPLLPGDALAAGVGGDSVKRSLERKWQMRMQPVIDIEGEDLAVTLLPDGSQQVTISLLCKPRNEVVFDTAQLSFEYEATSNTSSIHTITELSHLDWTASPSGWQRIELALPAKWPLEPGTKVRLSLTAFAFQPRPGYYRICKPYEFNWKPAPGTVRRGQP